MNGPTTFTKTISDAGLYLVGTPEIDGRIHRFKSGEDKEANSWYVLHDYNGLVVGAFGCWKRQISRKYSSKERHQMSAEEWNTARDAWKESELIRQNEEKRAQAEVRSICGKLFANAPATEHGYLTRKQIPAHPGLVISDLPQYPGWLAIPLRDIHGMVHSAQLIPEEGPKKFIWRGKVSGCFYKIAPQARGPLIICEGYATGASIHAATGWCVVCAMSCGNMAAVAKEMRTKYPNRSIVIAADNDQFTDGNPGLTKAEAAAKSINALLAYPSFGDESLADKPTDFNDLHQSSGDGEVRRQIHSFFPVISVPIGDLKYPQPGDKSELLKYRYLCERGSLLIPGPTGMGKSSFVLQCFALWSLGLPAFGIHPTRPLRCLLIQAENDDGDMAEMRDGICTGLNFTKEQRREFFHNVEVHASTGITGRKFCTEVVRPLLDVGNFNIFGIDPALSFIGGDVKEQKCVGDFLRVHLNPIVYEHECANAMVHHTNKPGVGKEKPNWTNGELAYTGSGSAEWSNWARAIIALQGTGKHGIYTMNAAKRGGRLGWRDEDDAPVYDKTVRHSTIKGQICWFESDPPADLIKEPPKSATTGRPNTIEAIVGMNMHEFLSDCPEQGEGFREIARRLEYWLATKNTDASRATCQRAIQRIVETRKLRKVEDKYLRGENA